MTTEDDFQSALDANPDDWQTRLVFADWLDERGDPRGPGYRVLGLLRRWPTHEYRERGGTGAPLHCPYWTHQDPVAGCESIQLPRDWFEAIELVGKSKEFAPAWVNRSDATRRELDDAAAHAFAKLSSKRQTVLLKSARA